MKSDKFTYEMANSDDPEAIIMACQKSFTSALLKLVDDMELEIKHPGMTWEQIRYFIKIFGDKKPSIVFQNEPQ